MSAISNFKASLEETLRIAKWSPSEQNLKEIAREIAGTRPGTRGEVGAIVVGVCPDTLFVVLEGLDNSDLRTLLALAAAAASQG